MEDEEYIKIPRNNPAEAAKIIIDNIKFPHIAAITLELMQAMNLDSDVIAITREIWDLARSERKRRDNANV